METTIIYFVDFEQKKVEQEWHLDHDNLEMVCYKMNFETELISSYELELLEEEGYEIEAA